MFKEEGFDVFRKIVAGEEVNPIEEVFLKVALYAIGVGGSMLKLYLDHSPETLEQLNVTEAQAFELMNLFYLFCQFKTIFMMKLIILLLLIWTVPGVLMKSVLTFFRM